ncbi:glycine zipper family protein [Desulfoferrobacter suflitae]|uniref:glycine zipper family protein n=1 Tax=Desulfoferrobacter suflitae TaxID=2865782 RepID=UPI002164DEA7|nr:glycine zipper family protein [Desulfoferrobacter suflitae]MCK8603421.1 glycine zipper domain-containing protein [Desulfoferrobacter suflitae]
MRKIVIIAVLTVTLALVGCAGMSETQQRTLSGGAMGAAGGAAIGALAGNAGLGAAIGGAAGATGGFLYGKHVESNQRAFNQGFQAGRQSQ